MDEQNGYQQGTPEYYYSFLKNFKLGSVYYADDVVPKGTKTFVADGLDYWTIVTVPVEIPLQFISLRRPVPPAVLEDEDLMTPNALDDIFVAALHQQRDPPPAKKQESPTHDESDDDYNGDVLHRRTRSTNARKRTAESTREPDKTAKPRGRPPQKHPRRGKDQNPPVRFGNIPRKQVQFDSFPVEYHRNSDSVKDKMKATLSSPNTVPYEFEAHSTSIKSKRGGCISNFGLQKKDIEFFNPHRSRTKSIDRNVDEARTALSQTSLTSRPKNRLPPERDYLASCKRGNVGGVPYYYGHVKPVLDFTGHWFEIGDQACYIATTSLEVAKVVKQEVETRLSGSSR